MKKQFIILLCTIILIINILSSCNQKQENTFAINEKGELILTASDGTTQNLGKVKSESITATEVNDAGELIITYSDGKIENLGLIVSDNVWRDRQDEIYTLAKVNLRVSPTLESKIVYVSEFNYKFKRIATNGVWNKIIYNNKEFYIKSEFSTPDINEVTFEKTESKIMYAEANINLFTFPCVDEKTLVEHNITVNTQLIKTEENKNGTWIKVQYGENTYYCRPSSVSEEPYKQQTHIDVEVIH